MSKVQVWPRGGKGWVSTIHVTRVIQDSGAYPILQKTWFLAVTSFEPKKASGDNALGTTLPDSDVFPERATTKTEKTPEMPLPSVAAETFEPCSFHIPSAADWPAAWGVSAGFLSGSHADGRLAANRESGMASGRRLGGPWCGTHQRQDGRWCLLEGNLLRGACQKSKEHQLPSPVH